MLLTITLEHACDGGEHVTLAASRDGGASRSIKVPSGTAMREPITQDELETTVLVLTKLAIQGLTKQQARVKLQAGFSVTI